MEAKYNPYRDNPNRTKCEERIYDQGYEAGIREVVEWARRAMEAWFSRDELETKLKEWEIDNE